MFNTIKSNKELRKFGIIFSGYFLFFSFLFSRFNHHLLWEKIWLVLAGIMLAIFIFPKALLPLNFVWEGLLTILRWINVRILLGIIFFFIFSPIAFFRKLFKKNTLHLSFEKVASYREKSLPKESNDIAKPY